jgi:Aminotransferase class I and II
LDMDNATIRDSFSFFNHDQTSGNVSSAQISLLRHSNDARYVDKYRFVLLVLRLRRMNRLDSFTFIVAIIQSSIVQASLICRANQNRLFPLLTRKFTFQQVREPRFDYLRPMSSIPNGSVSVVENGSTEATEGVAKKLARPNILELQPYRCARDDYSVGILLDANENAYGPPISAQPHVLERYPDPYQFPLKEQLIQYREYKHIKPENIFVGVGSDEAIDLLMRIFCTPEKDSILITPPTYGMYKVCAKVNDVPIVSVPLTPEFDVQIPQVRSNHELQ